MNTPDKFIFPEDRERNEREKLSHLFGRYVYSKNDLNNNEIDELIELSKKYENDFNNLTERIPSIREAFNKFEPGVIKTLLLVRSFMNGFLDKNKAHSLLVAMNPIYQKIDSLLVAQIKSFQEEDYDKLKCLQGWNVDEKNLKETFKNIYEELYS